MMIEYFPQSLWKTRRRDGYNHSRSSYVNIIQCHRKIFQIVSGAGWTFPESQEGNQPRSWSCDSLAVDIKVFMSEEAIFYYYDMISLFALGRIVLLSRWVLWLVSLRQLFLHDQFTLKIFYSSFLWGGLLLRFWWAVTDKVVAHKKW